MINTKMMDDVAKRFNESLPPGVRLWKEDVDKNVRAMLDGMLDKMDLVTREEFDIQKAVLAKTRSKLEQLEQQVAGLEKHLNDTK